jgi:uncharacterized protein (DUF849 family)
MPASSPHNGKVIITCAVTGSIHTPSMSPALPVTPSEIASAAVDAAEAGAAILHLHARDPETGRPDQRPEAFEPFLARIKQGTNAIVNLTSGGAPFMTIEERIQPSVRFKPELASLNMGSMNFGLFPMLKRFKDFKHDWEPHYLESTRDLVFRNTFKDIEFAVTALSAAGTRFAREQQRRAGPPRPRHRRGPRSHAGDAGRGTRDSGSERRRLGGLLMATLRPLHPNDSARPSCRAPSARARAPCPCR